MASKTKSKIGKRQCRFEDRTINLERFAYDVFSYSALKFCLPENCICRWEGEDNDYGYPDFILALSRKFLKYQITQRNLCYSSFKSRYASNKFESFEHIRKILQEVIHFFVKKEDPSVLQEVLISLSVINEIIIFLFSENRSLYLKELAHFWLLYFLPMKTNFEKDGGLTELYTTLSMPNTDCVDSFYDDFITGFCFPYSDPEVLGRLNNFFHARSDLYFKNLTQNLSEEEKNVYYSIMFNTVWSTSINLIVSQPIVQIEKTPENRKRDKKRAKTCETDLPENTGLGIPQHEELLRDVGVPVATGATSPQNLPGTSSQRPARERKRTSTQEKRQKWKPDSTSSVEKDFEKLNLDSSRSKDLIRKKK